MVLKAKPWKESLTDDLRMIERKGFVHVFREYQRTIKDRAIEGGPTSEFRATKIGITQKVCVGKYRVSRKNKSDKIYEGWKIRDPIVLILAAKWLQEHFRFDRY